MNYSNKLTKFQMSKIISSSLYNLNYVCTSKDKMAWNKAKKISRNKLENVLEHYLIALEVLKQKCEELKKDIIKEWIEQSVTGEQI
ncbi:MAG: hypothetical protein ACM3O3_13055 [Syntrophothermus sp.]